MKNFLKFFFGLALAIVLIRIVAGKSNPIDSAIHEQAATEMQHIENQVAEDAVQQYEIAKRGGDATDIYVHASMVTAAYLQAKDEANYQKWKAIEREDAKAAGMP